MLGYEPNLGSAATAISYCPANTASMGLGDSCTSCSSGSYSTGKASSCTYYTVHATINSYNCDLNYDCSAGEFCTEGERCEPCQEGYLCIDGVNYGPCYAGTYIVSFGDKI